MPPGTARSPWPTCTTTIRHSPVEVASYRPRWSSKEVRGQPGLHQHCSAELFAISDMYSLPCPLDGSQGGHIRGAGPEMTRGFSPSGPCMQLEQPQSALDSPDAARALLSACRLRDPERGWRNLAGLPPPSRPAGLRDLGTPLARLLPRCPDPDMALNSLERFLAQPDRRRSAAVAARKPRPHPGNPPAAVQHQPVVQRSAQSDPDYPRHAARAAAAQPQPGGIASPAPSRG